MLYYVYVMLTTAISIHLTSSFPFRTFSLVSLCSSSLRTSLFPQFLRHRQFLYFSSVGKVLPTNYQRYNKDCYFSRLQMSTSKISFGMEKQTDLPEHVLAHKIDRYDGAVIESDSLPSLVEDFTNSLQVSLDYWREKKRRGIWLKIPLNKASFVPVAAEKGFVFHHAERDYVMMTHWLGDGENRLPANASHQVGVGCLVLNEGKILLVQEKNGPLRGSGVWKLPTGLADAGEDIAEAAVREVLEETGVETSFERLLCFRQSHNFLFGKSDLWFVCILKPKSFAVSFQEAELVGADWHDPETLFQQSIFQQSPLHSMINTLIRQEITAQQQALANVSTSSSMILSKLPAGIRPGMQSLYHFPSTKNSSERDD